MSTATIIKPVIHEAGEEQVWIPLRKIEVLKPDPRDRSYSRPVAEALAEDFKVNGQLHPIHVRPHPDSRKARSGCYQQITGLHRLEGQRIAGSDAVLCVIRQVDDAEFGALRDAENGLCNRLSKDQQLRAVTRLEEFYVARARHKEEEAEAARQAAVKERAEAIGAATAEAAANGQPAPAFERAPVVRAKPVDEHKQALKGFVTLVAQVLGVSPRTSSRVIRCAKMIQELSPEQREILFPSGKTMNNIRDSDLEALAGLEEEPRRKAIALAASGMAWPQAIKEHTPPPEPVIPPVRTEDDYDNQEWLEAYCGRILPKINNRAAFEVEAIKWREFRKIRRKVRQVKELMVQWRNRRAPGLYEKLLHQAWFVAHPNDWIPCGTCASSGVITAENAPHVRCPACEGGGFKLKIERWE